MRSIFISSKSNVRFKQLLRLKQNKAGELFFVEGERYIRSAYAYNGISPESIVCAESVAAVGEKLSLAVGGNCAVLSDSLFSELSETVHSQGMLAVYRRADFTVKAEMLSSGKDLRRLYLVLDEVQDPGNVGAMVRTADAAGIGNLLLVRGTADPYSPKATRASAGSILNVKTLFGTREEILDVLRAQGCDIVVTATDGEDFRNIGQIGTAALILGNEARGVHFDFLKNADYKVGIPMRGGAESLNVAVASGILLYHFGMTEKRRGYEGVD